MREADGDPYCFPGTSVLKNRLDLRSQEELDAFEASITAQRADEPLPSGRLGYRFYCAIHRHLFQDVYDWAGQIRTVRVTKGASSFCYPENIDREMRRVFDALTADDELKGSGAADFAGKAAHLIADLNAIRPFREGNGRTQSVFLSVLADRAGHPLDFSRLHQTGMLNAMMASFGGDERPLAAVIRSLMRAGRGR